MALSATAACVAWRSSFATPPGSPAPRLPTSCAPATGRWCSTPTRWGARRHGPANRSPLGRRSVRSRDWPRCAMNPASPGQCGNMSGYTATTTSTRTTTPPRSWRPMRPLWRPGARRGETSTSPFSTRAAPRHARGADPRAARCRRTQRRFARRFTPSTATRLRVRPRRPPAPCSASSDLRAHPRKDSGQTRTRAMGAPQR
mmetsp:Transcript_28924/g.72606  ORF Transcript_28924/g.72606 Transcript_28924/m.72606 type:complete len:201 (-) Transcript_28924:75-677(-)